MIPKAEQPKNAKKTKNFYKKAAKVFDKSPLEVMQMAVRAFYEMAMAEQVPLVRAQFLREAADLASKAAPYVHRKMPTEIEQKDTTGETMEAYVKRVYGVSIVEGEKPLLVGDWNNGSEQISNTQQDTTGSKH